MAKIVSVTIRRFKRLREVHFDLDLAAVFVGGNNSGKSSILQALHFAIAVAQSARLVSGDRWDEDTYSAIFRPDELIYTPSGDIVALGYNGQIGVPPATWIEVEIHESGGNRCLVAIGRDAHGNVTL